MSDICTVVENGRMQMRTGYTQRLISDFCVCRAPVSNAHMFNAYLGGLTLASYSFQLPTHSTPLTFLHHIYYFN